jgi:C-terminal processing protease CtpA/Prc
MLAGKPSLVCLVVLVVLMACSSNTWASEIPSVEAVRARVVRTVECAIDQDVSADLEVGQAVRFAVADNRFDIREFFVYPSADGLAWVYGVSDDGTVLTRGGKDYRKLVGTLDQLGRLPCIAVTKWRLDDETLHIDFVLSADKTRNRAEAIKRQSSDPPMAINTRTWDWRLQADLTETERLAGFVRFWSEVKYNFAFFDQVPDLDWHGVLVQYLPQVQNAASVYEYYDVLRRCAALLKDGHTNIWGPTDRPEFTPPVRLRGIAGRAIIEAVMAPEEVSSETQRTELQLAKLTPGEEVVRVDGRPVADILEADIYPRICASTPQARDLWAFPQLLQGPYNTTATLVVRDLSGAERQVQLTRRGDPPRRPWRGFEHRMLGDGIAYVHLPSFGSWAIVEDFTEVFDRVRKARGLILDVRHNGGGNTSNGYGIVAFLIAEPIKGSSWRTRQYMPAFRAWGREEAWYEGDHGTIEPEPRGPFRGPVVVLTSPNTASAAEDFVVALHAAKRARIVGQRTNGSTGQPLFIGLPGGGKARICTKRDTYPDGRDFVGIGVIPDVEVGPSRKDIAAGRDAVLEKGLEVVTAMIDGN